MKCNHRKENTHMIIPIHANHGVLAHENKTFYTANTYSDWALYHEQVFVEVPDEYRPEEIMPFGWTVEIDGRLYPLFDVLVSEDDKPVLSWVGDDHCIQRQPLEIVEIFNV